MANEYVLPTGFSDPNGSWTYESSAYNGSVDPPVASSVIPAYSWSNYLELTIDAIYCSKIKFYATYHGTGGINSIDLDVYYDGVWHDVYQGSYLHHVWVEKTNELVPTQYVTKMRMRFYNSGSSPRTAQLAEAMFYEAVSIPKVTTNAATDVAGALATLNGNITDTGGATVTTRGFKYKEVGGGEVDASDSGYFSTGAYTKDLTGLDPTKKYYFRAYATNSEGTGYGDWLSFGVDVDAPTVTSGAATLTDHESSTLNGEITATGGGDVIERGFQYGLTETATWTERETGTFGIEEFALGIEDLENYTKYYFRAYAKNAGGTSYGSWLNFTTDYYDPEVVTHSATEILINQAKLNGEIVKTGGADCEERGFEYGLTKTAEKTISEDSGGYGVGFFDRTPTGLSPNTTYWYRAYAKFETGIG